MQNQDAVIENNPRRIWIRFLIVVGILACGLGTYTAITGENGFSRFGGTVLLHLVSLLVGYLIVEVARRFSGHFAGGKPDELPDWKEGATARCSQCGISLQAGNTQCHWCGSPAVADASIGRDRVG